MKNPLSPILAKDWIDLHDPQVVWQIAILLCCFALAWGASRALRVARIETDGIWIDDPENGTLGIRSEIYLDIWRAFQKAGIEIPFPQREIRILPNADGIPG